MPIKKIINRILSKLPANVIIYAIILIIISLTYGIIGSHHIMNLNFIDSLYFTVITMATVGYGDIMPVTTLQKIFSISLALIGVGIFAYIFSTFITNFITKVEEVKSGVEMKKKIEKIEDHYILCGYGRVGQVVLQELLKRHQKIIIVEKNKEVFDKLKNNEEFIKNEDIIIVHGDATENEIMEKFKIEKSYGLILTTGSDVSNLFIVLTIRDNYPNSWIVSRASKIENISRLYSAGANKVISPEASGGNDLYYAAVKPNLIRITDKHGINNVTEEMEVVLKHKCTVESIEYHFPGIKSPLIRKIGVLTMEQMLEFDTRLKNNENAHNSLNSIYESVNGIHSHWISGPNQETLNKVVDILKNKNLILGVNLSDEEIMELSKKYNDSR